MSDAQVVGRYTSLDRLPGVTGSSIQRQMATLKARLIARYRLHTVPGRPEELAQATLEVEIDGQSAGVFPGKVVSIGYGCGTIRVRKHDGRRWSECLDFQPNDGWHAGVYQFLDTWLGYVDPLTIPHPYDSFPVKGPVRTVVSELPHDGPDTHPTTTGERRPRPIRDNPQA